MPKASRATAAVDMGVSPEDTEEITTKLGEYLVCFDFYAEDGDAGMGQIEKAFPGGSLCGRPHWGYVLKGRKGFRFPDREEIYEAGDAYYAPPGHLPINFPGSETVEFQPATGPPILFGFETSAELVVHLLSETQLVPEDRLTTVGGRAQLTGSVGTALVEVGVASSDGIARMLALKHRMPHVDLASADVDEEAARLIPLRVLERVEAIPWALVDDLLYVAVADPGNLYGIDELRLAARYRLDLCVASRDDILTAIGNLAGAERDEHLAESDFDGVPDAKLRHWRERAEHELILIEAEIAARTENSRPDGR